MQYQFVRKKKTVDSAILKSDTLDASVTACQRHIDQALQIFWERTTSAIAH